MDLKNFLEYMKADFSNEKLENSDNIFFETFFYYKRNIKEFIQNFKEYNSEEQKKIISFLLNLYPLSDSYLNNIFRETKIELYNEIVLDTINYICSAFVEEVGEIDINFDLEIENKLKQLNDIKSIIEFNQLKMTKLYLAKHEFALLKEKDDKLSKDIKEIENGSVLVLREEIITKQKKYDDLKIEKVELSKQFEKLKHLLNELSRYGDLKQQVVRCRDILKESSLPKDYTDKEALNNNV